MPPASSFRFRQVRLQLQVPLDCPLRSRSKARGMLCLSGAVPCSTQQNVCHTLPAFLRRDNAQSLVTSAVHRGREDGDPMLKGHGHAAQRLLGGESPQRLKSRIGAVRGESSRPALRQHKQQGRHCVSSKRPQAWQRAREVLTQVPTQHPLDDCGLLTGNTWLPGWLLCELLDFNSILCSVNRIRRSLVAMSFGASQ